MSRLVINWPMLGLIVLCALLIIGAYATRPRRTRTPEVRDVA